MSDTKEIPASAYQTVPKLSKNAKNVVTINFVEDGLTCFGKIWYRGEELSVVKGSDHWRTTLDSEGNSWMERSESEQIDAWGKRMFRPGAWDGGDFDLSATDPEGNPLTEEEKAILAKHSKVKKASPKKSDSDVTFENPE